MSDVLLSLTKHDRLCYGIVPSLSAQYHYISVHLVNNPDDRRYWWYSIRFKGKLLLTGDGFGSSPMTTCASGILREFIFWFTLSEEDVGEEHFKEYSREFLDWYFETGRDLFVDWYGVLSSEDGDED